jgi:hypothetical protein
LGALTFREAQEAGNVTGLIVGAGQSGGGTLLILGWALGGTPIGVGVALLGAILSLGAAVVSFFSGEDTSGTHAVFKAYLDYIGREAGPLDQLAKASPSLRAAYEAVKQGHGSVRFWLVDSNEIPQLSDLGFQREHIVAMIGVEHDRYSGAGLQVDRALRRTGRIN